MLDDIRLQSTDSHDIEALFAVRDAMVKQALSSKDIALLQAIIDIDRENLAVLSAEKKMIEAQLGQLNKVQQYATV